MDYSFVIFGLRFQRGTCTDQLTIVIFFKFQPF